MSLFLVAAAAAAVVIAIALVVAVACSLSTRAHKHTYINGAQLSLMPNTYACAVLCRVFVCVFVSL